MRVVFVNSRCTCREDIFSFNQTTNINLTVCDFVPWVKGEDYETVGDCKRYPQMVRTGVT